ncbi:hypothetical protein MPH_03426 [Macrophomina phaseolina MS6]|uniref:Uncharacterized protein n=1 Tax=Macrophomina phaseolina (strain MS6) TaxID=1126212 RepID=K2S3I6_MACPH|nr:hypothetical protein MPH_03426 [Macrophomina phaseolina MS6]
MKSSLSILTLLAAALSMAAPAPEPEADPNNPWDKTYPFDPRPLPRPDDNGGFGTTGCNACFNFNCPQQTLWPAPGCNSDCNTLYNPTGCRACYTDSQLVPLLACQCRNQQQSPGWTKVRNNRQFWPPGFNLWNADDYCSVSTQPYHWA